MVKTNRNMWVLILLSLVTFGIYPCFTGPASARMSTRCAQPTERPRRTSGSPGCSA